MTNAHWWHAYARTESRPPLDRNGRPSRDAQDVTRWLGEFAIPCPRVEAVGTAMTQTLGENSLSGPGSKYILALTGPVTVGKSTLVHRWAAQRYREFLTPEELASPELPAWKPQFGMEADRIPVVIINLHSAARVAELNMQILAFMGRSTDGTKAELTLRVAAAFRTHDVRLLIVDDVHLLNLRWKDARDVLNHLKFLNTQLGETGASMLVVGPDLDETGIVDDPQIRSRMARFELKPYELGQAFADLLRCTEAQLLPYLYRGSPGMLSSKLGTLIWRRTQGYMGDLGPLIRSAARAAFADRSFAIIKKHIVKVILSDRARVVQAQLESRRPATGQQAREVNG